MTDDLRAEQKRRVRALARDVATARAIRHNNPPGPWIDEALCRGMPSTVFFPPAIHGRDGLNWSAGRAMCDACPVTQECLEWAIHHIDGDRLTSHGMFGGKTPEERRTIRRHRRVRPLMTEEHS